MMLDRLCVSTWSFHTLFETGRMQILDFPELVADRYGVHNLEIVAPHFGDADPPEVQARLDHLDQLLVVRRRSLKDRAGSHVHVRGTPLEVQE